MKKAGNETPLDMAAGNSPCTRRELVRKLAAMACAAAVPSFLLSCGEDGEHAFHISFEVTFSGKMNTASVENALTISPADADTNNAVISWSADNTVMYYKTGVSAAGDYTVTIDGTALSATGNRLDGNSDGTGGDAYSFILPAV